MSDKRYQEKMTDEQVLDLLKVEKYRVDLVTGEVFNSKDEKLSIYYGKLDRKYVRLYDGRKSRREISLPKLIWMFGTKSIVPDGFEIHHRDTYSENNNFNNLICLHRRDHQKLHGYSLVDNSEVPF